MLASACGILGVDCLGLITHANARSEVLTGQARPSNGARISVLDLFHAEDRHRLTAACALARETGHAEIRARIVTEPHGVVPMLVRITATIPTGHLALALLDDAEDTSQDPSTGYLSEAFYHTFLEQSPVGIVHLDKDGRVTFENHRLRVLSGEEAGDSWLGLYLDDVAGLDPRAGNLARQMLAGGKAIEAAAVSFVTSGGAVRSLSIHGAPIHQPGQGIVGGVLTITDVTAARQREIELSARRRYDSAEPALRNAALSVASEHAFLDETVKILGEVAGAAQVFALLPNEDADAYEEEVRWARERERSLVPLRLDAASGEAFATVLAGGTACFEVDAILHDPSAAALAGVLRAVGAEQAIAIPFTVAGNRGGALLLVRDEDAEHWNETDRLALAHLGALFETLIKWLRAEARYGQVIGTIEDSLFSFAFGPQDNRVYSIVTQQVEALTGFTVQDLLSGYVVWRDSVVHPDDVAAIEAHDAALREGHEAALVYRIIHRSGAVRWLRESASPSRDRAGRIVVGGILSDVTAVKETEESLLQAMQDAEAANRLKSSFLATMSHELRTPLGAIKGFAELLEEETSALEDAPAEIVEFAQVIHTNANKVLRLVSDLFDLAKLQTDRLPLVQGTVAVHPVVEQLADRYRAALADQGLQLKLSLLPSPPVVRADASRLDQVLDIVLSNAVKFTEQGHVAISTHSKESWIVVRIEDTGIGIEDEYLPQLFEPFTQEDNRLNRAYDGSGLGLALAERLMLAMQGEIDVVSARGEGTRVEIRLPDAST